MENLAKVAIFVFIHFNFNSVSYINGSLYAAHTCNTNINSDI